MKTLQKKIDGLYKDIKMLRACQEEEEDRGGKEEFEREINAIYGQIDLLEIQISLKRPGRRYNETKILGLHD